MRIFGLQSAEGLKLNGLEGKLQSLSPETGRWNVILDSGDVKAIKSTNLEVRPGTASWWLPILLQLVDLELMSRRKGTSDSGTLEMALSTDSTTE